MRCFSLNFPSLVRFTFPPLYTGAMVHISMTSILLDLGFLHVYHLLLLGFIFLFVLLGFAGIQRAYGGLRFFFILGCDQDTDSLLVHIFALVARLYLASVFLHLLCLLASCGLVFKRRWELLCLPLLPLPLPFLLAFDFSACVIYV